MLEGRELVLKMCCCPAGWLLLVRESLWLLLCDAAAMLHQEPLALVLVGWVGKSVAACTREPLALLLVGWVGKSVGVLLRSGC